MVYSKETETGDRGNRRLGEQGVRDQGSGSREIGVRWGDRRIRGDRVLGETGEKGGSGETRGLGEAGVAGGQGRHRG